MAYSYQFFPEHNLIYVRYSGVVTIDDYLSVIEEVPKHPDFHIESKQLIDLTYLTKIKPNYVKVMMAQARIAEYVAKSTSDILSVVVAPTPVAMEATKMVLRSWDKLDTPVVRRVVSDMTEAELLLGLPKNKLAQLVGQPS